MVETLDSFQQYQRVLDNTVSLRDADRDELDIQITRARSEFNMTGRLEPLEEVFTTMNLTPTNSYSVFAPMTAWYRRNYQEVIDILDS